MAEAAAAVLWLPHQVSKLTRAPTRKIALPTQADFDRAVLLPDKPLKQLHRFHKLREFLIFSLYFAFSLFLFDLESDWTFAHTTYDLYEKARKANQYNAFDQRIIVPANVDFLQPELTNMTEKLARLCQDCRVGVTSLAQSLDSFTLQDFVCSDFDSIAGSNDYPDRDCLLANQEYAAAPSPLKAPCCAIPQLVQASMATMAWSSLQPQFLEPDFLSGEPEFQ